MANEEKATLMLLTAEFFRHKSHYIEATYKKKIAEETGRFGTLSTHKKEMDKHLHKMQAVVAAMEVLRIDLDMVDVELDGMEQLAQETYSDFLKHAE